MWGLWLALWLAGGVLVWVVLALSARIDPYQDAKWRERKTRGRWLD